MFKKMPPTDFELRNPEARRAYTIREAKKEITKSFVVGFFGLAVVCAAAYVLEKKLDETIPAED